MNCEFILVKKKMNCEFTNSFYYSALCSFLVPLVLFHLYYEGNLTSKSPICTDKKLKSNVKNK